MPFPRGGVKQKVGEVLRQRLREIRHKNIVKISRQQLADSVRMLEDEGCHNDKKLADCLLCSADFLRSVT